ncbi:MAG TPA: aldehyde dehydrogenase family protein, partial [Arenibacter sp.]|nr:aldehyde dehydrogenase family protein [Arenibacter sp.]
MEYIRSINPYDGRLLEEYRLFSAREIDQVLIRADHAFRAWKDQSVADRAVLLKNLGKELTKNRERLGILMAKEMGKPIAQAIAEVEKCVWACGFYAKNATRFLSDDLIETEAQESFISYDPIG